MPVAIGLSDVHYAILTKDDSTGVAYSTPKRIYGAISANKNPNSSTESLFADDGPSETSTTLGQIELELTMKDLPLEQQSEILGHSVIGGVLVRNAQDVPPYIAIGYKRLRSDGTYRFKWLLKGKASEPGEESETKGDSINYQTPSFTVNFVHRDFDKNWEYESGPDTPGFSQDRLDKWFDSVEPTTHVVAPLTITTLPADGAAGVGVDGTITLTGSQEFDSATVTAGNIIFSKKDGTPVPHRFAVTGKVITITPENNLDASTDYLVAATKGVKDIFGNSPASSVIACFTTS